MSDIDDFLIFRGGGSGEAEDFIRAVNVQAFKKGKSRDQEWLSTFASAAFAGKALRWYWRLPPTTREDWKALQQAILDNDWDELKSSSASSIIIPAAPPAAAPPAITSPHGRISTAPNHSLPLSPATSNPVKSGRIRVITDGSGPPGYLVLSSTKARLKFSTSSVDAIVVEWGSTSFPCTFKLVGEDSEYCLFGAQFNRAGVNFEKLGPGNLAYLFLTPVTNLENGTHRAMTGTNAMEKPAMGRVMATVWSVLQDGSLVATLVQDRVIIQLQLVLSNTNHLWFATDAEATIQAWPDQEGKVARLYLDML